MQSLVSRWIFFGGSLRSFRLVRFSRASMLRRPISAGKVRMSGLSLRLRELRVTKEQMQRGTARKLLWLRSRDRMVGATTLMGRELRLLWVRMRTVRQADHSGTSGIFRSRLKPRFSSPRLGSSSRQCGMTVRSLCCRLSFTTCIQGEERD